MFVAPNATWMDQHYNWNDPQFKTRVGVSLNLAANYVACVLHTLWLDPRQAIPEISMFLTPATFVVAVAALLVMKRKFLEGMKS